MLKRLGSAIYQLRVLETAQEMSEVEEVQRQVWPGNETDIVPAHLLLTAAHNGGLLVGAYQISIHGDYFASKPPEDIEILDPKKPPDAPLIGFVFGFPGTYQTADGPRLKHCSHMLGVLSNHRDHGLGFTLKRAQWQMIRTQGIDLITWTYDPLQSRNAYLNISRLGAVCNAYIRDAYGEMRDALNVGISSDRFQVDWWVNTNRVSRRLSRKARRRLDLAHFLASGAEIINPSKSDDDGFPRPAVETKFSTLEERCQAGIGPPIFLLEIPSNISEIKAFSIELAQVWRLHTRNLLERTFNLGYYATDFIHLPGAAPRSFYVLSHGEGTL